MSFATSQDRNNLESICEEHWGRESVEVLGRTRPARSPSADSHNTVAFSINSSTPLQPRVARSETDQRMVENAREIVEQGERSRMDTFARELHHKLIKLSRRLSGKEDEEEKNARELQEACQRTLLYLKIKGGNDSSLSLATSSDASSFGRRCVKWASRSSVNSPRKNSKSSAASAASKATNTPDRSGSAATFSSLRQNSTDARSQRRISLPLETDPVWRRNHRYFRQGSLSSKPLFHEPVYEPEEDEPTSCEVVHVISNPTNPLGEAHTVYPGSESPVHRLSDSPRPLQKTAFRRFGSRDGNDTFSQVEELDSRGRKKVRLVWGTKVDQIIPHFRRDECNHEDTTPKRKRWQQHLGEKYQNSKKLLKEHGKKILQKMKSDRIADDMDYFFPMQSETIVDDLDGVHPGTRWMY